MKQLAVLAVMTAVGCVGSLFEPFWGVLLYYSLAVLRPQYIWKWALPGDLRWSLVAGLMVVFSFVLHAPRVVKDGLNAVSLGMSAYGVLVVLSCLTALDPTIAERWGIEYAKLFLIALIAAVVIRKTWHLQAVAGMIPVAVGYLAWEINVLYFFHHRLDIFHGGYGGLDNNGAGLMLAMGLPFAFCFTVSSTRRWQRAGAALLGLLILHAVLMTYSRGAMLSGLVGGLWILIRHRPRWRAGVLAGVLTLVVSVMAGQEIRDRFMSITSYDSDPSAQSRLESWSAAWDMIRENPLVGHGIRNSNQYSQNYGADRAGRTIHNQYLQIAADSGLPALLAYLVTLGLAAGNLELATRKCRNHQQSNSDIRLRDGNGSWCLMEQIALACQGSLLIYAVGGLFLSLEMFELPWVVLVLAGVLPKIVRSHADATQTKSSPQIFLPQPAPSRHLPRHNPDRIAKLPGLRGVAPPGAGLPGVPGVRLWKGWAAP